MSNSILTGIRYGWHPMRILRLVLALIVVVQAIVMHDMSLSIFGGVFLLMAVFNVGCCGTQCYSTPSNQKSENTNSDVEYEEIK